VIYVTHEAVWIVVPLALLCVLYVFFRLMWQRGRRKRCIYCGASAVAGAATAHEPGCRGGAARW
jgi:hypothetical protein